MALFSRFSTPRRLLAAAMLAPMAFGGIASSSHLVSAASGSTNANTLTIGWNIETKTLDPAGNSQNPDIWVQVNIFDRLLQVSTDGKSLQPDLATSWNISKDGKTYTFHLRPNITFQDGSKVTASDVAFDIMRAAKPAAAWSWTLTEVNNVQAPDPNTVVVHLKYPWSPFLSDVSLFDTGIYPEAYFKKVGASGMAKNPVGSGPYMFDSWVRGQYVRLKKDPTYWNAAKYPMQYVEYELIPNDTTRLLDVESGQLDVDNLLADNLIPQVQHSSTAQVQINPSTETNYLTFNTKVKPFQDV
ncbi:MAG TPA: ABC transporter substrate-binding protein, partial [Chloroflexota bacterium]|nr:ABC transporter substrate-binding protein [Chloroflexota bacterium]